MRKEIFIPQASTSRSRKRIVFSWVSAIVVLCGLIALVILNWGEAKNFATLLEHARPSWLILALVLQAGTYLCAGAVWSGVLRRSGHSVPVALLARLSVIKLTADHLVPTVGMSGNLLVVKSLRNRRIPAPVAMEALIVNALGHYAAFGIAAGACFLLLWRSGQLSPFLELVAAVFAFIILLIPAGIFWMLAHRTWKPPQFLAKRRIVQGLLDMIQDVSPERVASPRLLFRGVLLQLAVFCLDAATLWATLQAIGTSAGIIPAFVALVMATVAAMVSFLPGGIGSFEAGSVAMLTLLGIPVEAALTGTLLLRVFTLWLPLVPGIFLMRHEVAR